MTTPLGLSRVQHPPPPPSPSDARYRLHKLYYFVRMGLVYFLPITPFLGLGRGAAAVIPCRCQRLGDERMHQGLRVGGISSLPR